VSGLKDIHNSKFVYLNLNPKNIFIGSDNIYRLGGLGVPLEAIIGSEENRFCNFFILINFCW
jgi:hypothetical protein